MDIHFATAWEHVARKFPHRTVSICDGVRLSWQDFENRAAQLAGMLAAHDIGAGAKGGIYLNNCNEYLEAQFALFKLGGCPVNLNYRYKSDELVALLTLNEVEVLFFHGSYAMRIWEIKDRLTQVKLFVQIDDNTEALVKFAVDYERALRPCEPLPVAPHALEAPMIVHSAGTTGLPKGVIYPIGQYAGWLLDKGLTTRNIPTPTDATEYEAQLDSNAQPPMVVMACPLMSSVGTYAAALLTLMLAGTVVMSRASGFDADRTLGLVEDYRANELVILGDTFAEPLIEAIERAHRRNNPYDITSLEQINSSGMVWRGQVKEKLLSYHDMTLIDDLWAAEGLMATSTSNRNQASPTANFSSADGVVVVTEDGGVIPSGSVGVGLLARSTVTPIGYQANPQQSSENLINLLQFDGIPHSLSGDFAEIGAAGDIQFFGRKEFSIVVDGERFYAEAIEEIVREHDKIQECLVVVAPAGALGEQAHIALAAAQPAFETGIMDAEPLSQVERQQIEQELYALLSGQLAANNLPRRIMVVDNIRRGANGRPNYGWAQQLVQKL